MPTLCISRVPPCNCTSARSCAARTFAPLQRNTAASVCGAPRARSACIQPETPPVSVSVSYQIRYDTRASGIVSAVSYLYRPAQIFGQPPWASSSRMIARLLQRLLVSLVGAVLLPSCAVRCALKPGDESTALVNGEGTRLATCFFSASSSAASFSASVTSHTSSSDVC